MLTLSWSDGNTLIPVNSCLLASAKDTNIIGPVKTFDNRTVAGKRRKLAQTKAPEAMMTLLDTALSAGMKADYVLFDSWFSNPAQVTDIHSKGMNVIAMIKKSSRIKYSYCGEQLNIKEIFGECHSLSYDTLTAHVAIVFTRYMLLAMEQRQNEDQRTLGELFFFLVDEMADITFSRSLAILMAVLMASLQEILKLSDEQLTAFTADFEARLPEYLRNALHPEIATA